MFLPLYDEDPSSGHKGARMTAVLVVLNIAIFVLQMVHPEITKQYALLPADVQTHWWTLITNAFLHGGLLHLLGNLWFLWTFGDNVEDHMGSFNFLAFYLACGLLSSVAECISFANANMHFLGASGAISGVLAAYFFLYPDAKVRTLVGGWFWTASIPAWVYIGIWYGMQVLNQMGDPKLSGGVSYAGHIAGFAAGIVLCSIVFPKKPALVAKNNCPYDHRTY